MKFYQHFTVKKTSLPLPAERFSCLYIQYELLIWMEYVKSACLFRFSALKYRDGSHYIPNTVRLGHRTEYSDRQKVTGPAIMINTGRESGY